MGSNHSDISPEMADSIAHTAGTYDAVPYLSFATPGMHPARMAANARLLGLSPSPVPQARILEIGCATGAHSIPIAATFPGARLLGIDISPRQIELGQVRIKRLGLRNIELQARSLSDLNEADGSFDYIICHGVYSWIPNDLRKELMRVIGARLAPTGVAVVSYNVLPGWRLYQVVRDSMLLHAQKAASQKERIEMTRSLFEAMKNHAPENTYGQIWRTEAPRMARLPDFYLTHELFETNNLPCTFTDFMETASPHGLTYLCETNFSSNVIANHPPGRAEIVRHCGNNDPYRTEQYVDITTGRTFRESLLVRSELASRIDRSLDPERLDTLHVSLVKGVKIEPQPDGTLRLVHDDMENHATDTKMAEPLRRMAQAAPGTLPVAELSAGPDAPSKRSLHTTLLGLYCMDMIELFAAPVDCVSSVTNTPRVWSLAASDASVGLEKTATLCHTNYEMTPFAHFLLPLLDGSHAMDQLLEMVLKQAEIGGVSDAAGPVKDPQRLRELSKALLDRELARLVSAGMMPRSG